MFIAPTSSIITLYGSCPGPTTAIMVGVHGNELSGPRALIQRLAEHPTIDAGTVFCIFANPNALKQNIRFTEKNMNRCFFDTILDSSYESIRAQEVLFYLRQSDILLDIHNTINLSTPAFLISEHSQRNQFFPVQTILSGLDDLHPGGSDGYMNSINKIGLCLECGSIVDNETQTTKIACDAIINFLRATGNCLDQPAYIYKNKQKNILCYRIYNNVYGPFQLIRPLYEFETISRGTLIGYDGEKEIIADDDRTIVFARNCNNIGEECFVIGYENLI